MQKQMVIAILENMRQGKDAIIKSKCVSEGIRQMYLEDSQALLHAIAVLEESQVKRSA